MPPTHPPHRKSCNEIGHAHELTFSCYHGYPFLVRERTCLWLAEYIDNARKKLGFKLWAYVFMPNHAHLIIHFGRNTYDIAEALQEIRSPVSRKALAFLRDQAPEWLPRLKQQRGQRTEYHFWQRGGGYDRNAVEPSTLERMMEYIHMNPVRIGLVHKATDWKWSSAGWYARSEPSVLLVDRIPSEWTVEVGIR